jgi:hypothetical protein
MFALGDGVYGVGEVLVSFLTFLTGTHSFRDSET